MSYEGSMLRELNMPLKKDVEIALLKTLFKHNGILKEFSAGENIVEEIANDFALTEMQKNARLTSLLTKDNRLKKSSLWHRLLYRAADNLAKNNLVCRPSSTLLLTNRKEWMLTERGFDKALQLLKIPSEEKYRLPVKSVEVQKAANLLTEKVRPDTYEPFENKRTIQYTREVSVRSRGFRQAVIEAYDYSCAVCGLKLHSPKGKIWEVEAAHIVPHSFNGKDDLLNAISLCQLHHWCFDVGWFAILDDYTIDVSEEVKLLPELGNAGSIELIRRFSDNNSKILLPNKKNLYPHLNSITWHRLNIFNRI